MFHVKPLRRPVRRGILVAHVAVSVSWLGLTVDLLALGLTDLLALSLTAFLTGDPATANAATRAMKSFGDWPGGPGGPARPGERPGAVTGHSVGSGRVWTKFWLTLVTTGLSIFSPRPGMNAAAANGALDMDLVIAPAVATATYLFIPAISVLKPGVPRRGRRLQISASSAKSVDARSPRQTA
ncbi:hypothetical protein EES46_02350 [Streptomyces sp. ADI98-10]|nr:hypothetical protein EES46_02350 [Streptomyces sp. ADI98-10]